MCARILGLEDVRTAMRCMAVDPMIIGLLVRGPVGTGKSSVVREMSVEITGTGPVVVPHGCTEEQLTGDVDVEHAVASGELRLERGILGRADGRVVLVDDVNLFDGRFVRGMMDSVRRGEVRVERDGLSERYPCRTSVVATMGTRETVLNGNLSDLFDMSVTLRGSDDPVFRRDVMEVDLLDVPAPVGYSDLDPARRRLSDVVVGDDAFHTVARACDEFGCRGFRGEISTLRVARALAAMECRTEVSEADVARALYLCLGHRRGRVRDRTPTDGGDRVVLFGDSHIRRFIHDDRRAVQEEGVRADPGAAVGTDVSIGSGDTLPDGDRDDVVQEVGDMFDSIDLVEDSRRTRGMAEQHRRSARTDRPDGRYVSSRPYVRGDGDLALDATVRSAAPFQSSRRRSIGCDGMVILPSDLRTKVRESRMSCTFLFMIDNSGSLVIRSRMRAVKAAVLSILSDHHSRRDSVAVMTFNESFIGMVLPPTRSVGGVRSVLEDIPVGRKTPLSEALHRASDYLRNYAVKHPTEQCFVIVMTDAMANMSMVEGADPFEEALSVASRAPRGNVEWVVVDTAAKDDPRDMPERLATALGGVHYRLDDLRSSDGVSR